MGFEDDVMRARQADLRDEIGAAKVVSRSYSEASSRLSNKVAELKKLEKIGAIKSATQQRKIVEGIMREVDTLADAAAKTTADAVTRMRRQVINTKLAETASLTAEKAEKLTDLTHTFDQVPVGAVNEMATRPILNTLPAKSAFKISAKMGKDIKKRITTGLASGDSVGEMSKDIQKITGMAQSAATRLVRTNLSAATNDALRATYENNPDVFDGYTWDATLDDRVCMLCASLHGTFFPLGSNPPGPPRHHNCRCTLVGHMRDEPVDEDEYRRVRPLRENPDDKLPKTQLIKRDTKFETWLRKQPRKATRRITGTKIKDDLWRSRKLGFDELVQANNGVLSDKEAVKRALAFNPKDKKLKELAKQLGVQPVKASTVRATQQAEARAAAKTKTLGTKPGQDEALKKYHEKLDKKNAYALGRKDAVQQAVKDVPETAAAKAMNEVCNSPCKVKSKSVDFPAASTTKEMENAFEGLDPHKLERKALGKLKASGYGINREIVEGKMSGVTKKRINRLDGLMARAPVTTKDFRMTAAFPDDFTIPSVGKEFKFPGFVQGSVSSVGSNAIEKAAVKSKGKSKFFSAQVRVRSGSTGVYSGGPTKDFTLPRGARLHVVKKDASGIVLEVMDTPKAKKALTSLTPAATKVKKSYADKPTAAEKLAAKKALKEEKLKAKLAKKEAKLAAKEAKLAAKKSGIVAGEVKSSIGPVDYAPEPYVSRLTQQTRDLASRSTSSEVEAFRSYSSTSSNVNRQLRKYGVKGGGYTGRQIENMDSVFRKAPPLERDLKVARFISGGWRDAEKILKKPGHVFVDRGYASTTFSQRGRNYVSRSFGGFELEIRVPKGFRGMYLRGGKTPFGLRRFNVEDEYLLPRGTKYKVVSIDRGKATLEIIN